jgi:uncharacterized membrane protein
MMVPTIVGAQATVAADVVSIERAKVIDVQNEHTKTIVGTDTQAPIQTLTAQVLSGDQVGKIVTFENDYTQLAKGDQFYIRHQSNSVEGTEYWVVSDPYRLDVLGVLAGLFLVLLFVFGGIQGVRGLASLIGSVVLILYVLLPGILAGYSPVLVSVGVAGLIIVLGSYVTHGFTKTTSAAVVGMLVTVVCVGIATYWAIHAGRLSGYSGDEQVYLNFDTKGGINMVGLLFGGVMIGLLGVLYDIAIGQAVAVEELYRAGTHLSRRDIYKRSIRIGREHIGALVNTLAIAYVGVALPLLLLIQHSSTAKLPVMINSELFATEIIRVLVGGIGIILAVPITTYIATYLVRPTRISEREGVQHSHRH